MPFDSLTVITPIGIIYNRGRRRRAPRWLSASEGHALSIWPMQRFECSSTGLSDPDAANFDSLVAGPNGPTPDGCEFSAEKAA
jgi:hypothetical protein